MTIRQALAVERLWAEGKTGREIAIALGKSEKDVYDYARRHRGACPKRRQGMRADEGRDARAARLVAGGATHRAAGEALGVHERTIARMVKRHREREKEDA